MLKNLPIAAVILTSLFGYTYEVWATNEKCENKNELLTLPLEFSNIPTIPSQIAVDSTEQFVYTVINNSDNFDMTVEASIEPSVSDVTLIPSTTNDCSATLAPGDSCNITVQISPTSTGEVETALHVNYDDSCFVDLTSPIEYTAVTSVGLAYVTNSAFSKAGNNVEVCHQISTDDATNGELVSCVDAGRDAGIGFSQPSAINLFAAQTDNYALVTNFTTGAVDVCQIQSDGKFSTCTHYSSIINNAYGVITAYSTNASKWFTYVTNGTAVTANDNNVEGCEIDDTNASLSNCDSAFLTAVESPLLAQVQIVDGTTYAYFTNETAATTKSSVTVCAVNPNTFLLENCFDSGVADTFGSPYGIAFYDDTDDLYAYVVDTTPGANEIFICPVNSTTGGFEASECTSNTEFDTPADITFYTIDKGESPVDYAFVIEQAPLQDPSGPSQTSAVVVCPMSNDGTGGLDCLNQTFNSLTPVSDKKAYAVYQPFSFQGVSQDYVYITNARDLLQCKINAEGKTHCINAFGPGVESPMTDLIRSVTFNFTPGYITAYLVTQNKIFVCEVDPSTGILDAESCRPGGPNGMNDIVGVVFAPIGGKIGAYLADRSYSTIFVCDVLLPDSNNPGEICNCAPADGNNGPYTQLESIAFMSVWVDGDPNLFVYAVDYDNTVWQCNVDGSLESDGKFTETCTPAGVSSDLLFGPISINTVYASLEDEENKAYILNSQRDANASYSITKCTIDTNAESIGEFTDCSVLDIDNTILNTPPNSFTLLSESEEMFYTYAPANPSSPQNFLLACDINTNCRNPLGVPYNIAIQMDGNNTTWAYISNIDSGGILKCVIEEDKYAPILGSCADAGTEYRFTSPYGIAFQTYENTYAFIVDAGEATITQCTVRSEDGILTDCAEVNVPNVSLQQPIDISFETIVDGEDTSVYAYITDKAAQNVILCAVDTGDESTPPSFTTCQATNTPHFNQPLAVGNFMLDNGVLHLYIPDANTGRIGVCPVNEEGKIENCMDTGAGANYDTPSGVTVFSPDGANSYLYVANSGDNTVLICPLDSTSGEFSAVCIDSGVEDSFNQPISIAFSSVDTGEEPEVFAYITNFGNNTVSQCTLNSDGTFASCDNAGPAFSGPRGIALTNSN